jgi:hypothetical protein
MPKPTHKNELTVLIQEEFGALEGFLKSLSPEEKEMPCAIGIWSAKDVLAHLYEWQQMFLSWYQSGLEGKNPVMPAEGYKWSQTPELNELIYQKHHEQPLEDVIFLLHLSHEQMLNLVASLSEDEIFSPGRFSWTRKNALSTYLIPCTSSHYHWARTEMRKGLLK